MDITVYKHDHAGREVWQYGGQVLARGSTWIQLEARFNRPDHDAGYVVFRLNDRFIEWFYSDRGYNVFEIHDVDDDQLKGWYCNITRPARLGTDTIRSDDLALDVWVGPDGSTRILDEDEFVALDLDEPTRDAARAALADLIRQVAARAAPFDKLPSS